MLPKMTFHINVALPSLAPSRPIDYGRMLVVRSSHLMWINMLRGSAMVVM